MGADAYSSAAFLRVTQPYTNRCPAVSAAMTATAIVRQSDSNLPHQRQAAWSLDL